MQGDADQVVHHTDQIHGGQACQHHHKLHEIRLCLAVGVKGIAQHKRIGQRQSDTDHQNREKRNTPQSGHVPFLSSPTLLGSLIIQLFLHANHQDARDNIER